MKKDKTPISDLPVGTRIKLTSLDRNDAYYPDRKKLVNKEYRAVDTKGEFISTAFRKNGDKALYVFYGKSKYKILKKQLV